MKTDIGILLIAWAVLSCSAVLAQAPGSSTASQSSTSTGPARSLVGYGLYIAGDGFSLEQAIEDGLREKSGDTGFIILVLGAEIGKLGVRGASSEVGDLIQRGVRGGAVLQVCERDVKRLAFSAQDFLPMVEFIRGFSTSETGTPNPEDLETPPLLRRIRSLCSD